MITIRRAERNDTDALFVLIDALADYEKLARPTDEARARLVCDGWETSPPRFDVFLAINAQAAPVGYCIVVETYSSFLARPTLYLEDLFVLPEARGQGAGDALIHYLAGEALRRGCGRMEWVCLNWNQLAIGFYEKRGATHLDDWRYYRFTHDDLQRLTQKNEHTTADQK